MKLYLAEKYCNLRHGPELIQAKIHRKLHSIKMRISKNLEIAHTV